jgi:hypothetical protein
MTTPGLRVIPHGLRALAQRCETLAGQVGVSFPTVTASPWQSSSAAATTVNAGASRTGTVFAGRMRTTGAKLMQAADAYEAMDDGGAAALAGVASSVSGGGHSGGDGGAGGPGLPSRR